MFLAPPLPPLRRYGLFISHAWEYNSEYDRVVALLKTDSSFRWENLSVPEHDPLPGIEQLPKSYRCLVHQLDERISKADCVLVLAGMYCAYSGWIQSEIEAAKHFSKPIIAVEPRGQERFPEAVRQAADATVGWAKASIIDAVRMVVTPTFGLLANMVKTESASNGTSLYSAQGRYRSSNNATLRDVLDDFAALGSLGAQR